MTIDEYRARLKACANYIEYAQEHKVSGASLKRDALDCALIAAQAISEHGLACKFDRSASGTDPGMGLALTLSYCVEWAVDCDKVPVRDVYKLRRTSKRALEYAVDVLDTLAGKC